MNNLKIKKGVLNIKIAGKSKKKKIVKHNYFSNQDTLDKYVHHKTQSRHPRSVVRPMPSSQSTLDLFLRKNHTSKQQQQY